MKDCIFHYLKEDLNIDVCRLGGTCPNCEIEDRGRCANRYIGEQVYKLFEDRIRELKVKVKELEEKLK